MVSIRRLILPFLALLILLTCFATADELPKIRMSLPPVMGSLPLIFAQGWELFEQEGVDVELIGLSDNQARNLALVTSAIDGMICDLPTAVLLVTSGTDIVITSTAYQPEADGNLALLAQSYFKIESIADLLAHTEAGNTLKSIAITPMSDLEYHIDALLTSLGYLVNQEKDYSYWYDLLQLATFLSFGSVYAAVLPEPYITYISNYPYPEGPLELVHLSDFEGIDLLPSVIVFRREVIEESPELIEDFYTTYQDTITMINTSSREELVEMGIDEALSLFFPGLTTKAVPEGILDSFAIPQFQPLHMLCKEQFEDVVNWANAKGYTWKHPSYEEMTTDRFLQ